MNTSGLQREEAIQGDSPEDTRLLKEMVIEAKRYLASFSWCPPIRRLYLGHGIGGVVAVFLVEFTEPIAKRDNFLWVVVGDLPSAYMVTETCQTPIEALLCYCELMENWANAAMKGKAVKDKFPVQAAANQENARELQKRVDLLRLRIIPSFGGDPKV